jgi:Tfp pilus assembly protein PilX
LNKRGVILIFSLLVTLVLSALLASLYFQSISEKQLAKRYADSVRALWLAEAGIAKVKSNLGISSVGSYIDDPNYTYNVLTPTRIGTTDYYTVVSTGTVTSPSGGSVSRTVSVTMKLTPPNASKFPFCVETTSDNLTYKEKNLENTENPANIAKTDSTQTFGNLFGVSTATMKAGAGTYYESRNLSNSLTVSGITWVDVTDSSGALDPSVLLQIEHLNGSGTLIICGNFKITGLGTFDGILYVIGTLTMNGNPTINGTVFAESSADIGMDLSGSSLVKYSSSKIVAALIPLSSKQIVSWQEN